MWLPSSQPATHESFAAQGLQKLLWNYNLASRVRQIWKTAGGAPQSRKRAITAFRLCVANSLRSPPLGVVVESGFL